MTKRKGKHLDLDGFDAATDGMMTRLREFRDAAHRARSEADFAERAEADFRLALSSVVQEIGAVLERDARDGVLDRRALERALGNANQALTQFSLRSDAHYAERQSELDRHEEAVRAAQTALMDEPAEEYPHNDLPEPSKSAQELKSCRSTRPAGALVVNEMAIGETQAPLSLTDETEDDRIPGFLRRNAA